MRTSTFLDRQAARTPLEHTPGARRRSTGKRAGAFLAAALLCVAAPTAIRAVDVDVTVNVVDGSGEPVNGFRWLLQEDNTDHVVPDTVNADTLSLSFHKSHAPVLANGHSDTDTATIAVPVQTPSMESYFFLSVLPDGGHSIGGAPIRIGALPAQLVSAVTVTVQKHPIPTAQISVFVFEDTNSINNAPDLPQELGLEGFKIVLEDAGGKYGASAGTQMTDAFGNPLGTVYDVDGSVAQMGDGVVTTGPDGRAQIKNLSPGKYGISVVPPANDPNPWQQTATIEGTKVIDAWGKANEPPFFVEFGPPGFHVFVGFVKAFDSIAALGLGGGGSISGRVVSVHNSRPPNFTFEQSIEPIEGAWVGLNEVDAGGLPGQGLYAAPTNAGEFTISGLADGTYQLAIWDRDLTVIFATQLVTVDSTAPDGGAVVLGDVAVFNWFGRLVQRVFDDTNENGFWDDGEAGLLEVPTDIRFRDGTVYQAIPTDLMGEAPYDEVFPFFNWLVAEVGFDRWKATGLTKVIDGGGEVREMPLVDPWSDPTFDVLNPQQQFVTDPVTGAVIRGADGLPSMPDYNPNTNPQNNLSHTETGELLLQAFQLFLGQTIYLDWGKRAYDADESGGIAGIAYYAVTRAEDDPGLAAAEPWEPGIPRVQVNLYEDEAPMDGVVDNLVAGGNQSTTDPYYDPNNPLLTMPDIDNYPLSADPDTGTWDPGPEDHDWNGNGDFDLGDAVAVTWTDSWDDNPPTGCQGNVLAFEVPTGQGNQTELKDCFDGLRSFNQARPGVFDGGYAFPGFPGGPVELGKTYIVEVATPPGYQVVQEEDKNVDFGDEYIPADPPGFAAPDGFPHEGSTIETIAGDIGIDPATGLPADPGAPPPGGPLDLRPIASVGRPHTVPSELTLFPGVEAPFAGETRPGAERKQVTISPGINQAVVDFFLFTEVPIAGQIVGFVLNDAAAEFNPASPTFGEKQSPPFLPVSVRDWTGVEINRGYTDRWGAYNFLVPSTYTANRPAPSGMSPNMLTVSINDPGPVPNPDFGTGPPGSQLEFITDPYYNPKFSQFTYTFQYMPGSTTYLDTPVVPIGAFAGPNQLPADCEFPDGTPVIATVSCPAAGGGPYVTAPGQQLIITSAGTVNVPNPRYDPDCANCPGECDPNAQELIARNYGFGPGGGGAGSLRRVTIGGVPLTINSWTPGVINATVPANVDTGPLMVIKSDGTPTPLGVTVTVDTDSALNPLRVNPASGQYPTIQSAVDAAQPGDLILVPPGSYEELVILTQPVQLQGWGAWSTTINAIQSPAEKILDWRNKVEAAFNAGEFDLLPSQEVLFADAATLEPALANAEGAGISVFGSNTVASRTFGFDSANTLRSARIDGFSVIGASTGGGVFINGFVNHLDICNNRIVSNNGFASGGIRIGQPEQLVPGQPDDGQNEYIRIDHNQIANNGGLGFSGGGISIYTGSDYYRVTDNWICGNFTTGDGAGIGHRGLSDGGHIARNTVLFNQNFNQDNRNGGGISIRGAPPVVPALAAGPVAAGELTEGSGSVEIYDNLIEGNQAEAGNGGGISLDFVNGQDIFNSPGNPSAWYAVDIRRNIVVNNQAGFAAGGISLQDAVSVTIKNNTVVRNESTATVTGAFANDPLMSTPEPAGIVSHQHSARLDAFFVANGLSPRFSDPLLPDNIICENRSFWIEAVSDGANPPAVSFTLMELGYWDLEVKSGPLPGGTPQLDPQFCILTDKTGYAGTNLDKVTDVPPADPAFVNPYFNTARCQTLTPNEVTAITSPTANVAFDEGGNKIEVRFGPLTITEFVPQGMQFVRYDYHIGQGSDAIDAGDGPVTTLAADIDGQGDDGDIDIGADEFYPPPQGNQAPNLTAPVAKSDSYAMTTAETDVSGNVLANDFDPDGNQVFARNWGTPATGSLTSVDPDGSFTYDPEGFVGTVSFTYEVVDRNPAPPPDGDAKFSIGQVTITVVEPEVPPLTIVPTLVNAEILPAGEGIRVLPHASGCPVDSGDCVDPDPCTDPNSVGSVRVLANFPGPVDFSISSLPAHGCARVNEAGGVTYTPFSGYKGTDVFDVLVEDQAGLATAGTVTINVLVELAIPPSQDLLVQMPPDTDGVDTDGDGNVADDSVYMFIGGGDGFATMADGRPLYGFGFQDFTDLLATAEPVFGPGDPYGFHTVPLSEVMGAGDVNMGILGAQYPAPTIKVREGQKLYLSLTNYGMLLRPDLFDPHTVHYHGFPNAATVFDGVPDSSISINMGSVLTYYYLNVTPGTFMYHCHVEATEHMQMGMLGNLYVEAKQNVTGYDSDDPGDEIDPGTVALLGGGMAPAPLGYAYNDGDGSTAYDVEYPIQLGSFDPDFHDASAFVQPLPFAAMIDRYPLINGRGYPDTTLPDNVGQPEYLSQNLGSRIEATQGQRILLRISDLNVTRFHNLACTLPMRVVGRDAAHLRSSDAAVGNMYYETYSVLLGGGVTWDVIIDTAGVEPGTYLLYGSDLSVLHNNDELDDGGLGGMATEIVIQ